MQLSADGLEMIKRFEGFRGQLYTDVAGFPTIGYDASLNGFLSGRGTSTLTFTGASYSRNAPEIRLRQLVPGSPPDRLPNHRGD